MPVLRLTREDATLKFCYVDESGMGAEPYAVMVGVIADAGRMHVTKKDWSELLAYLSSIVGRKIQEVHTKDLYPGNGPFRGIDGEKRSAIITAIFKWLRDRRHRLTRAAPQFREPEGKRFFRIRVSASSRRRKAASLFTENLFRLSCPKNRWAAFMTPFP